MGLDPVSLSKIETHLLASLGSKGKNRNSLTCLRNTGFYSAATYCNARVECRACNSAFVSERILVGLRWYAEKAAVFLGFPMSLEEKKTEKFAVKAPRGASHPGHK